MVDHEQWELGREQREEPLGGIHVSFQVHLQEVVKQLWHVVLKSTC